MSTPTDAPVLWEPSSERRQRATLTRYMDWLRAERGVDVKDYHALWRWSVDELEDFWATIWDFFQVQASAPYERVLGRREMPGAEWFPGARLNYAEHIFRGKADGDVAVQFASERHRPESWTWGELRSRTAAMAAGLRAAGGGPGGRGAAYLPN